jgi:hypothetical protein
MCVGVLSSLTFFASTLDLQGTSLLLKGEKMNIWNLPRLSVVVFFGISSVLANDNMLAQEPKPTVVEDFLTEKEAETLLMRYRPLLRSSTLHGGVPSLYRTSSSVRLPPLGDPLVFEVERRAASLAGFNHSQVQDFQLSCYGNHELYGLHQDDNERGATNRASTVLIYLREPVSGGSTLFTRRRLQEEKVPPKYSEADSLKIFRQYCEYPSQNYIVVAPKQGRAVVWHNWYGEGLTRFAHRSTHGACPVTEGMKCVVQQWILKSGKHPLRDERIAAIFPAGSDVSFRHHGDYHQVQCVPDSSAQLGQHVAELCVVDGKMTSIGEQGGPFPGVGGLRVKGVLEASVRSDFVGKDFSFSFWAKDVKLGMALFSVGETFTMVLRWEENSKQGYELIRTDTSYPKSVYLEISDPGPAADWLWFSVNLGSSFSSIKVTVYSQWGPMLGMASLPQHSGEGYCGCDNDQLTLLRFLSPSDTNLQSTKDSGHVLSQGDEDALPGVSFFLFHQTQLDREDAGALRYQIRKYNKNV